MRRITKTPVSEEISKQLKAKQKSITNGRSAPDWELTKPQRWEIKEKLLQSQKGICCYCECSIDFNTVHIEHYFERHDRSDLIYNYQENMILSCEGDREPKTRPESFENKQERVRNISCGHKKSKSYNNGEEIDYTLLINPMESDSALISYYNGIIEASDICNEIQTNIVNYSITRLDLDCNRLNNLRLNTITQINQQLINLNISEQKLFISSLLEETQEILPAFFSTIKNNFQFILEE